MKSVIDRKWMKAVTLLLWSFVLTALTVFLGAAPLKVFKDLVGRVLYWGLGLGIGAALLLTPWKTLGIIFIGLVVLMGIFSDLEERGHGVFYSAVCSTLVTALLGSGAFAMWIYRVGNVWRELLQTQVDKVLAPAKQIAGLSLDTSSILAQLPSGILIVLMLSLFFAVLLEDRIRSLLFLGRGVNHHLIAFRIPDSFVWMFIAALLAAFVKLPVPAPMIQTVALNFLNVLILLFFFQGLAVVVRLFDVLRLGVMWRVLFFTLIVFQLFLFVSAVGLVDYWANFRLRFHRKTKEIENKENI